MVQSNLTLYYGRSIMNPITTDQQQKSITSNVNSNMSLPRSLSLYEYDKQIAAAFKVDCEELLEEFEKLKSLRFADFTKVWHLKNFTFVYA